VITQSQIVHFPQIILEVPVHQRRYGISAPCGLPGKFEDPSQTISLILSLSKVCPTTRITIKSQLLAVWMFKSSAASAKENVHD
jgi:hypothetical protein